VEQDPIPVDEDRPNQNQETVDSERCNKKPRISIQRLKDEAGRRGMPLRHPRRYAEASQNLQRGIPEESYAPHGQRRQLAPDLKSSARQRRMQFHSAGGPKNNFRNGEFDAVLQNVEERDDGHP